MSLGQRNPFNSTARAASPTSARCTRPASGRHPARRGNSLILVTAILVLLVITATAYLTRTRSVRAISAAELATSQERDRVDVIAADVAREISESLFPAPIDTSGSLGAAAIPAFLPSGFANPNRPRLPRNLLIAKYGDYARYTVDPQDGVSTVVNGGNDDDLPDFSYNFAPYEVRAFTNWPDDFGRSDDQPGDPSFGDTRWLRDIEPSRWDPNGVGVDTAFSHWQHMTYLPTANNGWRVVYDISNVTGSLVTDLRIPIEQWPLEVALNPSSISPPFPPVFAEFVKRRDNWFSSYFSHRNVYAVPPGTTPEVPPNFMELKRLGEPADEFIAGTLRNLISRTFADTDGDGMTDALWMLAPTSAGDGSLRHLVAVSVIDNAAMLNVNTATRFSSRNPDDVVVAGVVVPRTATTGRTPSDTALVGFGGDNTGTGFFDNVLNSQGTVYGALYDDVTVRFNLDRWSANNDGLTLMDALGVRDNDSVNLYAPAVANYVGTPPELASEIDRLEYWKLAGRRPRSPLGGLTPFGMADELELRAYGGNNIPSVLTRLERAVNTTGTDFSFLRSVLREREESSEYLDQLNPQQLLYDNRRKLTTHNATRNDVMPTWLWPSVLPPRFIENDLVKQATSSAGQLVSFWTVPDTTPGVVDDPNTDAITSHDFIRWSQLTRKIDLRAQLENPTLMVDRDGNPAWSAEEIRIQALEQRNLFRDHLLRVLRKTLIGENGNSYFGTSADERAQTESLIASYAANVESWMDGPRLYTLGSVNYPVDRPLSFEEAELYTDPANPGRRFIGNEKHPHLMEVFLAHVYSKSQVPLSYPGPSFPGDTARVRIPPGQPDEGQHFIDGNSKFNTVVVVQVANPYDTPIVLSTRPLTGGVGTGNGVSDYRIRVFGQNYSFGFSTCDNSVIAANSLVTQKVDANGDDVADWEQLLLLPTSEDEPRTAVIYAIASEAEDAEILPDGKDTQYRIKWRDYLDIGITRDEAAGVPSAYLGRELFEDPRTPMDDTLRFNASLAWSTTNPDKYDNNADSSVEIQRNVDGQFVVVDRLDFVNGNCAGQSAWEFRESANRLRADLKYRPPDAQYVFDPNVPSSNYYNGIRIGQNDYFVTWTQAARHWRNNFITGNPGDPNEIDDREKAPRYVLAERLDSDVVKNSTFKKWIGLSSDDAVGDAFQGDALPDSEVWFKSDNGSRRKPAYFQTRTVAVGTEPQYPRGFPVRDTEVVPGATTWIPFPGSVELKVADKVYYDSGQTPPLEVPFQMIQPDQGFTRVGDLALVPMWGPVVKLDGGGVKTEWTLGEILSGCAQEYPVETDSVYINRLRLVDDTDPLAVEYTPVVGPVAPFDALNQSLYQPRLPAGVGLFDAFVCDGPGSYPLAAYVWNSGLSQWMLKFRLTPFPAVGVPITTPVDVEDLSPRGAGGGLGGPEGFAPKSLILGRQWEEFPPEAGLARRPGAVQGLININTAPLEVLRALPHMSWMVHTETGIAIDADLQVLANTRVRVPEAMIRYRNRSFAAAGARVPNYADRGLVNGYFDGMRSAQGFASLGEVSLLRRGSEAEPVALPNASGGSVEEVAVRNSSFRIDAAASGAHFLPWRAWPQLGAGGNQLSGDARLSIDIHSPRVSPSYNPFGTTYLESETFIPASAGDGVALDAEERSLLMAGISNLITTRSDSFTVYLRVRTVRQNPTTGVWDGTDASNILGETRYVMLVDRSEVRRPGDAPKVLYFEKLPP